MIPDPGSQIDLGISRCCALRVQCTFLEHIPAGPFCQMHMDVGVTKKLLTSPYTYTKAIDIEYQDSNISHSCVYHRTPEGQWTSVISQNSCRQEYSLRRGLPNSFSRKLVTGFSGASRCILPYIDRTQNVKIS